MNKNNLYAINCADTQHPLNLTPTSNSFIIPVDIDIYNIDVDDEDMFGEEILMSSNEIQRNYSRVGNIVGTIILGHAGDSYNANLEAISDSFSSDLYFANAIPKEVAEIKGEKCGASKNNFYIEDIFAVNDDIFKCIVENLRDIIFTNYHVIPDFFTYILDLDLSSEDKNKISSLYSHCGFTKSITSEKIKEEFNLCADIIYFYKEVEPFYQSYQPYEDDLIASDEYFSEGGANT